MDDGRSVALFGCFIVFQFGVVRLPAREFTLITLYTLAAYALVINLTMHFRPQAIHDVPGEWMSWLGLAGFLPCMNIIGGQINTLRRRMRDSAKQLRLFADNVPAMTAYWDENFHCRFASKAFAAAYGLAIDLSRRDYRQFALLYLDLNKFKPVNDALGHAAGDELLKGVAARIRRQVRESDTVARVGGDEFTVILTDVGRREEAEIVAAKDARDADGLVKAADAAMYGVKKAWTAAHP